MITWVIGRGGLLGSAIERHLIRSRQADQLFAPVDVPWGNPQSAEDTLTSEYQRFRSASAAGPWRIMWAAGSATVSTSAEQSQAELRPLQALVQAIEARPPEGSGAFFLTSSAGGVYAGSQGPPFGVDSVPIPLSPYGELKLAQEALVTEKLAQTCAVLIGRFSNLYGPGQNLSKLQGLISRLALAAIHQQPISIFVPLDTIRDYIYVDDAAKAAVDLTANASGPGSSIAVIASGQPATVGQIIHSMGHVARRRIPVAYGSHPSSSAQALDLRLTPSDGFSTPTQLLEGMKDAYQDILTRSQSPRIGIYQASPASAG